MGLPQTSLLLTICATVIFCVHSASLPTVTVGTITGEQDTDASGQYILTATVEGGSPSASSFQWEIQDGSGLVLSAEDGNTFHPDYAVAQSWSGPNGETINYHLVLKNGLSASSQSITFRASASNEAWSATYIFFIPATTSTVTTTSEPGRIVHGSVVKPAKGAATIAVQIDGGSPSLNTYKWTVQQPDGTYVDLMPGSGGASDVTVASNGNPSLTLTVPADTAATSWRTASLRVSSVSDGFENWWVTQSWSIPPYGQASF